MFPSRTLGPLSCPPVPNILASVCLALLCACGAEGPVIQGDEGDPPVGEQTPVGSPGTRFQRASSGLTRTLYVLNEAGGGCAGKVQGFFQCLFAHTNWNQLANTYPTGESLRFGKLVTTSGVPCANNDFACAARVGGFKVTDYDVILIVYPSSRTGGVNGMTTVNGHRVNVAYVWSSNGSCDMQTVYGGHEVFEAQTDGVSADCCDGEVPAAAGNACLNWCNDCGAVCTKFGPTSCSYDGYRGGGSFGIATLSCGGQSYRYQKLSPHNHEFDGTCDAVVAH